MPRREGVRVTDATSRVWLQECVGNSSPTRMECFTPAFPRDETEEGELSFDMDGDLGLWNREFSYHPYGEPIPFETEGHVLSLYPGFDEVSLHVRAPTRPLREKLKDSL